MSDYKIREWDNGRMARFPAHPGKFEGEAIFAEWLYESSLESGQSDECGSCDECGFWAARFVGDEKTGLADIAPEDATEDERAILRGLIGAILVESDNGFVSATYYERDEADTFAHDWAAYEADANPVEETEDA